MSTDQGQHQEPSAAAALLRGGAVTLTQQLAQRLIARMRDHLLLPGARLPSVRQCAAQQGVSPSTVVAAYELLLAQGWIESQRGRGYFVRPRQRRSNQASLDAAPQLPAPTNAMALIRGMFRPSDATAQPGMGTLPMDWLETPLLGRALRQVSRAEVLRDVSLRYGDPLGDPNLRQVLAERMGDWGLSVESTQIITTAGATQALDLIGRTLLRAGDSVLVDELGWTVDFARLNALGVHLVPLPRDEFGPRIDLMNQLCRAHHPKLYISVSVLHNPTGVCISAARAHQVLQLAQQHGFWVVEDDSYSHLAVGAVTRMAALDGLQRVIYVSGFSKVLVPNWRVGYLAAPHGVVDALLDTKLVSLLSSAGVLERALAWLLVQGEFRRHAAGLIQRLGAARQRSVALALEHGCRLAAEPAGMFGWVDTGVDTEVLAQRLWDHRVLLAPGALFHARHAPSTLMRIGFATTQERAVWGLIARQRDAMAARR